MRILFTGGVSFVRTTPVFCKTSSASATILRASMLRKMRPWLPSKLISQSCLSAFTLYLGWWCPTVVRASQSMGWWGMAYVAAQEWIRLMPSMHIWYLQSTSFGNSSKNYCCGLMMNAQQSGWRALNTAKQKGRWNPTSIVIVPPLQSMPKIGGDFLDFGGVFGHDSRYPYDYGHSLELLGHCSPNCNKIVPKIVPYLKSCWEYGP